MNQITEYEIIDLFSNKKKSLSPKVIVGIGDDCAVLEKNRTHYTLLSKDILIEDIHFRLHTTDPTSLARKVINSNVSDIAACGGIPQFIILGISCSSDTKKSWMAEFAANLQSICKEYDIDLIGGDTTCSPDKLFLSITIIGEVAKNKLKLRNKAKVGDYIVVTGNLGDSAAGLYALENELKGRKTKSFITRHQIAIARLTEGQWLSNQQEVTAMIDISDGLETDLKHLLTASNLGAQIDISKIPSSSELSKFTKTNNINVYDLSLGGGEDYELLATISPDHFKDLQKKFVQKFNLPLTAIGKTVKDRELKYFQNGKQINLAFKRFNHFGV